jgi:hypothetical protein
LGLIVAAPVQWMVSLIFLHAHAHAHAHAMRPYATPQLPRPGWGNYARVWM